MLDLLWGYEDGIVFVDEVHLWGSGPGQHMLMQSTEDQCLDTSSGTVALPNLTVIAATTDPHKLVGPRRSRFGCQPFFERYSDHEMALVVAGMVGRALAEGDRHREITADTLVDLGKAAGGNPRSARKLAEAARDLVVTGMPVTTEAILSFTGIAADGLAREHLAYLEALAGCRHGQAGLPTMATMLGCATGEVRRIEAMLYDRGYVHYAGQAGRQIAPAGRSRLSTRDTGRAGTTRPNRTSPPGCRTCCDPTEAKEALTMEPMLATNTTIDDVRGGGML